MSDIHRLSAEIKQSRVSFDPSHFSSIFLRSAIGQKKVSREDTNVNITLQKLTKTISIRPNREPKEEKKEENGGVCVEKRRRISRGKGRNYLWITYFLLQPLMISTRWIVLELRFTHIGFFKLVAFLSCNGSDHALWSNALTRHFGIEVNEFAAVDTEWSKNTHTLETRRDVTDS